MSNRLRIKRPAGTAQKSCIPSYRSAHYFHGMQSDDLTKEQARALKNKIRPTLDYLGRLKRRMVRRGFLNDDPLLTAVVKAEDAMHALHVEIHYLSCGDKVGRKSAE
jgi:hypothetical protein